MPIFETIPTSGVPVHVYTDELEPQARQQLVDLAQSGIVTSFVAAMPDVHFGAGATVGSVFASDFAVCPNAVGVDIGCGMAALPMAGLRREDLSLPMLQAIHQTIKQRVPTGFAKHASPQSAPIFDDSARTSWLSRQISADTRRQLGTLGGGNHFIEIVYDETSAVWIMLHSGSRNIGKVTADHYDQLARAQMAARGITAPNRDLNHLLIDTAEGQDYLLDMTWCQRYAAANRRAMLESVASIVTGISGREPAWESVINIHHNYCALEPSIIPTTGETRDLWVTRKGATSARSGQFGIIPGSMGTGSFIVRGLGNPMSWQSCSHGAGRARSRTAAYAQIAQADFEAAMAGIVCETVPELRDEAPQAYKDISKVMANQADLVEPVHRLLPLVNVKGVDGGAKGFKQPKVPVSFVDRAGQPVVLDRVEAATGTDEGGRVTAGLIDPESYTLRYRPHLVGETRIVRAIREPGGRLVRLDCRISAADEEGIELRIEGERRA